MKAKPAKITDFPTETIDARLLLKVLSDFKRGDFTTRLPSEQTGLTGKIYDALNEVIELNERMSKEFDRVATVVGKEGRIKQRANGRHDDCRVQSVLWRKVGDLRVGHCLRNGHGRHGEARHRVTGQIMDRIISQRIKSGHDAEKSLGRL